MTGLHLSQQPLALAPATALSEISFSAMTNEEELPTRDERQGIQSVEIAATVLRALEVLGGPSTLGEIATTAGSQPNKVHRYLVSLVRVGLAIQSPISGRYDLGPALRRLGAAALRRTNDVTIASEHSRTLRDDCGHSVNVAVWSEQGPLIVRWDYGLHALPLSVRVGTTLPLLGSSSGRVFLSYLPRPMTADALESSRAARRTGTSEADVDSIIASVHKSGVAVANGAIIPGASSMSAPIFTAADTLPLVMTVVMPGEDVTASEYDRVRQALLATTGQVSEELGADSTWTEPT
jgi:DNA-binding IclR family transcriptional regulator